MTPAASDQLAETPQINKPLLAVPLVIMGVLWGASLLQWLDNGSRLDIFILAYTGLIIGAGIGPYLALPRLRRPLGRRLLVFWLGTLLLVLALITDHGNMQIEGLFFGLLAGGANFIIVHFLIAKIAGPLLFGRIWCGWACWFGMIFDLLPYPYSRYRIPGRWGLLRYAHFVGSLLLVSVLWFGFRYSGGAVGTSGLIWFIAGLFLYYVLGIGMAFALRDNRAFCKYLCPLSVLMKASTRFSLLKIAGVAAKCDSCDACVEMCPMNIRVTDYILQGERVLSTECTLCQTCINVCPHDALKLSLRFDVGGKEHVDWEPPKRRPPLRLPFIHGGTQVR